MWKTVSMKIKFIKKISNFYQNGKPTENTCHLTWRVGGGRLHEVWFGSFSSTAIVF
jgi:hypothetical protein